MWKHSWFFTCLEVAVGIVIGQLLLTQLYLTIEHGQLLFGVWQTHLTEPAQLIPGECCNK